MAAVEANGKTVEEAIENALAELDAQRDEVEIEILNEGRGGVLGVGASEARVRVRLLGESGGDEVAASADRAEPAEGEAGEGVEDEAEFAAQMLDKLLEMMGVTADVSIRDPETAGDGLGMAVAVLDVEGEDLGLLIGRRGETLTSLQYLLNLMASRQLGQRAFFTVDVEGYRRRRERTLTQLARRMADQVKRTHRPVMLEPMPPNERRIIHLALSEDRTVSTSSVGEGDDRKIEISFQR
ncbi:MAG TPA: RNA-binding cell elongation regulator Jag/EloR [Dehalococcoidia bacterium]|jgi:spoIIIJ-associated protein